MGHHPRDVHYAASRIRTELMCRYLTAYHRHQVALTTLISMTLSLSPQPSLSVIAHGGSSTQHPESEQSWLMYRYFMAHHHHYLVALAAQISMTITLSNLPYRSSPTGGHLHSIQNPHRANVPVFDGLSSSSGCANSTDIHDSLSLAPPSLSFSLSLSLQSSLSVIVHGRSSVQHSESAQN